MNDTSNPAGKSVAGTFVEAILPAIFLANAIIFAVNSMPKLASATGEAVLGIIVSFFSGYVAMVWVIARPLRKFFDRPNQ